MTLQQKSAWFMLSVALLAGLTYLVLLVPLGPFRAQGAMGFLGLTGLWPLLYGRKLHRQVNTDEREQSIHARASMVTFYVFWVCFVGAMMSVWLAYREAEVISVNVLPAFVWGGWLLFSIVHSTAVLLQYRNEVPDAAR